jgi:hypothetical protein
MVAPRARPSARLDGFAVVVDVAGAKMPVEWA